MATTVLVAPRVVLAGPPAVSEDVPIPGGISALARALEIELPDGARIVSELTRLVYRESREKRAQANSLYRRLIRHFEVAGQAEGATAAPAVGGVPRDWVPMPLPAAVWSETVFHRPVTPSALFAEVMKDPSAALLAHGLAGLDDETLRFLVDHPALITRLYEDDAAVFASFAGHLHVHDNRVVPPGGDVAVAVWEALLGEKTTHPDRFVHELFARNEGRIAYLYDTIGALDSSRRAFALGAWIPDTNSRVDRFRALASATTSAFREWSVKRFPFKRPPHDLVTMFLRVQVDPTGRPGLPASERVWARVFDGDDFPVEAAHSLERSGEGQLIDAAWLVQVLLSGEGRRRVERLDQFAFGQRVFADADAPALQHVLEALRAFPRYRMLMLTLERIGVSRPSVYAVLTRHAQQLSALDTIRGHTALAQFQGAIALVARLASVRTIDRARAETLLSTLGAVGINQERGYVGALAQWLQSELRPVLGTSSDMESVLLDGLAGAPDLVPMSAISWEGQQYRFDLVKAEARRLRRNRERQSGHSVDLALGLHLVAQRLAKDTIGLSDIQAAIADLKQLALVCLAQPTTGAAERPAAAMHVAPDPREIVDRAIATLTTIESSADRRQAAEVAESLLDLTDVALGEALLSLSYAIHWHASHSGARLTGNVARRHDFGLTKKAYETRVRAAWALPARAIKAGEPWHVEGAVLGLDIALAPLALRRVSVDPPASAPSLSEMERDMFVTSLALMNPFLLEDDTRDAIAEAVARGMRRIESLAGGISDLHALVREIAMDGWRVRALQWTIRHERERLGSLFSMTELLYLGGGHGVDLNAWGMSAMSSTGCICTHLAAPGLGTTLIGRPQAGLLTTTVADLNLRVAVWLSEMRLPAALAKSVLAVAVRDFVDHVRPSDEDDWLTLVRTAQGLSRERLEDFLAVATADGPLVPETTLPNHRQP